MLARHDTRNRETGRNHLILGWLNAIGDPNVSFAGDIEPIRTINLQSAFLSQLILNAFQGLQLCRLERQPASVVNEQ